MNSQHIRNRVIVMTLSSHLFHFILFFLARGKRSHYFLDCKGCCPLYEVRYDQFFMLLLMIFYIIFVIFYLLFIPNLFYIMFVIHFYISNCPITIVQ